MGGPGKAARITLALAVALLGLLAGRPAVAGEAGREGYTGEVVSDLRYLLRNAAGDTREIFMAPIHPAAPLGVLREPRFYYTLLGAAALLGGTFALDQTARARTRSISDTDARRVQSAGQAFAFVSSGLFYLYGFATGGEQMRESILTGYESLGVASLLTTGVKAAFGRRRPREGRGHARFFTSGGSFVSGAATPIFCLAAAVSESVHNRWYVAVPAYAGAAAVGLGRMGQDAHWLSDIAGSALLGVGVTEFFLYLHRRRAENAQRLQISPLFGSDSAGVGLSYTW